MACIPYTTATVAAQIEAVVTDIGLDVVKTGMGDRGGGRPVRGSVGNGLIPLVVDPVAASARGEQLLAYAARFPRQPD